jgi:hypothetical protein
MHDATRDKAAGYWLQEDVLPSVSHTERTVPRDELSWQKKNSGRMRERSSWTTGFQCFMDSRTVRDKQRWFIFLSISSARGSENRKGCAFLAWPEKKRTTMERNGCKTGSFFPCSASWERGKMRRARMVSLFLPGRVSPAAAGAACARLLSRAACAAAPGEDRRRGCAAASPAVLGCSRFALMWLWTGFCSVVLAL